ncbi:hypothetical protein [Mesorhizobium sp. B2-7-1]|uniref:hypothetical protein n=1 Tax=Mesorhizobium sp. B2-7-1 TaxID=2589909 RepID=UPI0011293E2A|nr:hypothetical protein [Mesorhizobium sp. B2-7-1]TPJ66492.1 hypothetical protein FJ471_13640 [Mesorhizobium sp. B2-7-1]
MEKMRASRNRSAPTVDFTTNCYENDWQIMLARGYLRVVLDRCCHDFNRRRLVINNVRERARVEAAAAAAVARGDIDEYLFVDDHAAAALEFFQVSKTSLGRGYLYSISELVALHISDASYLLYYKGDSYPKRRFRWIDDAVGLMEGSGDLVVANLCWNDRFDLARSESFGQQGDFLVGYGFSDQCFLVKMSIFRAPIYNEENPASARYPDYAGESFEKRVDAYMRNHELKRLTHRRQSYVHKNVPKRGLGRILRRLRPLA